MPAPVRFDGIDFWRGFALLSIFVNHASTNVFEHVTHRNFGFSDAAELFVFLSGVSVALAYGSHFLAGRFRTGFWAVLRRIFTLYRVHIVTTILGLVLFLSAGYLFDEDELLDEESRDVVLEMPMRAIVGLFGLSYQTGIFNILPLYIVLLMVAPLALALAMRSMTAMLATSALLYAAARVFGLNVPTWPDNDTWYFNPLTWQLLFVAGLFVGLRLKRAGSAALAVPRHAGLFVVSLIVVAVSAFVITNGFGRMPELQAAAIGHLDADKSALGLVRILHFAALAYAVFCSGVTGLMRRTIVYAPVCLIGRHSLPVFASGCVMAAIAQIIAGVYSPSQTRFALIVGAGLVLHYVIARRLSARAKPGERDADAVAPLAKQATADQPG